MTTFKDHFSRHAALYAAFRPTQPQALLDYVATLAPRRDTAWDCATGNGQAARGLAPHFRHVIATDASAAQIAQAVPHEHVEYRVAPAEASGLADHSIDLVTVAQALHWLDLDAFYHEVQRVGAPGAAIAVWAYGDSWLEDPELDRALQHLSTTVVGPYWPPERRLIDDGYRTLPFPFREVAPPAFTLEREWTLAELAGYVRSWSATNRYVEANGVDPVAPFERELRERWGGAAARRTVRWPIALRAGYLH